MAEKSLEAHLYECLKRGNTERGDTKRALYIIKLLGDDVNKLYRGKSLLVWAKEFENEDVINALSEKGAVEEVISDEEAERLGLELIEASHSDRMDEIERLIEAGADVNAKNEKGGTALMYASIVGNLEILEKLIEKGADIDAKSARGWTALMLASHRGHIEIVERLIEVGADVLCKDPNGKMAMTLASGEVKKIIIEAVKERNEKGKENEPSFMDRVKGLFGKGE